MVDIELLLGQLKITLLYRLVFSDEQLKILLSESSMHQFWKSKNLEIFEEEKEKELNDLVERERTSL